jgi:hypothetical protein
MEVVPMLTAFLAKLLPFTFLAQADALAAAAPALADPITDQDPRQYAAMTAIWVVCGFFGKLLDGILDGKALALWARVQPVLPLVLGVAAFWFLVPPEMLPFDKVMQGIIFGASVSGFHKLGAQTVLGQDSRVQGLKQVIGSVVEAPPVNPPVPPAP